MAITLENLKTYNEAVKAKKEEDDVPAPVVLLDKFRVRLVPLVDLPIVSHYSNLSHLGINSENVLVIDSKVVIAKEKVPRVAAQPKVSEENVQDGEEKMEVECDKENCNENGKPLETTFLTLEKLQRMEGAGMEVDIAGFDITMPSFDANPIPHSDGISLQRLIRREGSEHFAENILHLPIWISTFSSHFPFACWLAGGKTQKNAQFGAITRVLGYFDETSERQVNQLNVAFGGSQVNRYRAVYDEIRKMVSENRPTPGEVVLDMRWNTRNSLALLEQPVNVADCTIKIDLGWRDKRFFVDEDLYVQLLFVLNLADVLAFPEKEVSFPCSWTKFDDLVKEMNTLIETCSDDNKVFVANDTEEITSKVWDIVHRCGDIKQATLLLKNFLQALTYGQIKSHVQENNKSHLAALIRSSKIKDFRMPILERLGTVEMMMEIGVESLRGKVLSKFSDTLHFPTEELKLILETCQNELKGCKTCVANPSAVSLLPITMALATVTQIFYLLNEKDLVILPDLTRRVIKKFTTNMVEAAKKGEVVTEYQFETTLPVLRINKELFINKRPRVWTCENVKTVGANTQSRMMTVLELESSLQHVSSAVNAIRPIREVKESENEDKEKEKEKPTQKELNADYTVSHTVFTYMPKL